MQAPAGAARAAGSPLGPRARFELAAVDGDTLAHVDEAVAAAVAAPGASAVIAYRDLDGLVAIPDEHLRSLCPSVLERVGETLLDESVGSEVDAGWKRQWIALDSKLDSQPSFTRLLDQLVLTPEARLGRERLFGPPEHTDHSPHLRQRLASGLLDDEESLALALLLGAEDLRTAEACTVMTLTL
jgi:hypothetical protein